MFRSCRICSRWIWLLTVVAVCATAVACKTWTVVEIEVEGINDLSVVSAMRVRVYRAATGSAADGSLEHDGTKELNDPFRKKKSIGVFLPRDLRQFSIRIDALDDRSCPILSGYGTFNLDLHPALSIVLTVPTDETCVRVSDGGDAGEDIADSAIDRAGPPDVVEAPTPVACFDPTDRDAGPPALFAGRPLNAECNTYCADMTSACPGRFADLAGCLTVCTEAGWHLPADAGGEGTTLSCLAGHVHADLAELPESVRNLFCDQADPSQGDCAIPCATYCTLRRNLCGDRSSSENECFDSCAAVSENRPRLIACLIHVLQHDVPGDPRYCTWTEISGSCGRRCSEL